MKINETLVTVSKAVIPIDHELKLGDDVTLTIEGSVVKKEHEDNQDGTYNVICKVKGIIAQVREHGKIISEQEQTDL